MDADLTSSTDVTTVRTPEPFPIYPFERRPKFTDRWLNAWYTWNRCIERAPIVLITGAGASIAAGVPGLTLPPTMTVGSIALNTADVSPPAAVCGPSDVLDLESLLIVADILSSLPRKVVYHGLSPAQAARHRAVLGATVRMWLPHVSGGDRLSHGFVDALIDRLIALDQHHDGKLLDGLSAAITDRIFDACLSINKQSLVALYAPLFAGIVDLLQRRNAPLVLPIFTTNYDETLDFLGRELQASLSRAVGRDVAVYDATEDQPSHPGWRTWRPHGYRRFRPARGVLSLVVFYLHGSVRWFQSAEAKPWFDIHVGDASIARSPLAPRHRALLQPNAQKMMWSRSRMALAQTLFPEGKDPFRPGSIYYSMRLGYLFLERCLRARGAALAIGYSFRDSDCRDLLVEAWQRGTGRTLVVLVPRPEEVRARLGPIARALDVPKRFEPAAMPDVVTALETALG